MKVTLNRKAEQYPTLGELREGMYFVLANDPTRKLYFVAPSSHLLRGDVAVWPVLP